MKSICLVKDDLSIFGGREKILSVMANALCKDYCVHVVGLWNSLQTPPYFPFDERVRCFQILDHNARVREALTKTISPLHRYLKEQKIDVALSVGVNTNAYLLAAAVGTKVKTVCCEHSNLQNSYYGWFGHLNQWLSARFADKIVTLTKQDQAAYRKKFHLGEERVDYNYNCIDPAWLKGKKPYDMASKKLLSVGRFDPVKGYPLLVDVAKRVLPDHPDWQWHIYGDGEEFSTVQEKIRDQGLEKQLILKGSVKSMEEIYSQYAAVVLTSYHEGLPMVLLEAKANSLPIVSFDCATGPREIVRDGVDGYLVPVGDVEGMSSRLAQLMEHPSLRRALSEKCEENLYLFQRKKVMEKWNIIINSVCAQ